MEIKAIKNDKDYKEALAYVESLIDKGVEKGSVEAEKLEVFVTLIQDYESKMFPATLPDPIDALEFVMEQRGLSQEDLVPYIGSRSKVSEADFEELQIEIMTLMTCVAILAKGMIKANKQIDLITLKQKEFLLESIFIFEKYMKEVQRKNRKNI